MNKVKDFLRLAGQFIKAHPLTSAVMALMLAGLISFSWPTGAQAAAFVKEISNKGNAQIGKVKQLMRTPVEIPASKPDDPPEQLNLAVNAAANEKLKDIFSKMEGEYVEIAKAAAAFNKQGHELMLPGLFPEPLDNSKPFEARNAYIKAFEKMYAELGAHMPLKKEEVDKLVKEEEQTYKKTLFVESLTASQAQELSQNQAKKVVAKQQEIAYASHIYAEPIVINTTTGVWQPGPFHIGDWAKPGGKPDMYDIWEGQVQLWIQQDLIKAVKNVNKMDEPGKSVNDLPIKQLISIIIKPGYVGMAAPGASSAAPPADGSAPPAEGAPAPTGAVRKLPDDYSVSITGRKTNPVYDVRHATLSVLINARDIPQLLNAISAVNFMSVINSSITNVDEYTLFNQGFYFGEGVSVVRLDLIIESIWLRSWLAGHESEDAAAKLTPPQPFDRGYMPDDIRFALGLKPRAKGYVPKANLGAGSGAPAPQ